MLGFLFPLGFYDDSVVCSKYFRLGFFPVPWAYPLSAHGLGSVRPNLMKVHHSKFYPFSWHLHLMVRHDKVDESIG